MRRVPWICGLLLCAASLSAAPPAATQTASGPPPAEILPLLEQREAWRTRYAEILTEELRAMTRGNVTYATRSGAQRAMEAVTATRKTLRDLPKADVVPMLSLPPEVGDWGEFHESRKVKFLRVLEGEDVLVEGPLDASLWQVRGDELRLKTRVRWDPFVVRGADVADWRNGQMYHIPGTWIVTSPDPPLAATGIVNPPVLVPFDKTKLDPWKNWRPKKPAKKPR